MNLIRIKKLLAVLSCVIVSVTVGCANPDISSYNSDSSDLISSLSTEPVETQITSITPESSSTPYSIPETTIQPTSTPQNTTKPVATSKATTELSTTTTNTVEPTTTTVITTVPFNTTISTTTPITTPIVTTEFTTLQSSTPAPSATSISTTESVTTPISSSESQSKPPQVDEPDAKYSSIDEIIANMTLYEKLCQMLVLSPELLTGVSPVTSAGDITRQALIDMPVGGLVYNRLNMKSKEQVSIMLSKTQSYSEIPLILTCDEEGGRVNRLMGTVGTTYVGSMFGYKDMGTKTAWQNAFTIASDMKSLGFNTDLAPVADVWSNPSNKVIGDRAYSDDFIQAAELIPEAVRGFHSGGVATTLKHFPGHGDTLADSHYSAVYVSKPIEQLRKEELLPFKAGIDAGSDMVMMGHLILTEIDASVPAPFSYRIVTELLREELGFNGVVITDSLQMRALADFYDGDEIALRAVIAGVDILLCPSNPRSVISTLEKAVNSGEISEDRINQSVRRILTMKVNRGILTLG